MIYINSRILTDMLLVDSYNDIIDCYGDFIAKMKDVFSDYCSQFCIQLITQITHQKIICDRTLLEFNRILTFAIKYNVSDFPPSFDELSNHLSDYWYYKLDGDTNLDRTYSYIRLYQMMISIKSFYLDKELQEKVLLSSEENETNKRLIHLIRESPGITYRRLRESLSISSLELQSQLQMLENEGFLTGCRHGDERYYVLTNAGDVLDQTLSSYNLIRGLTIKQHDLLSAESQSFDKNCLSNSKLDLNLLTSIYETILKSDLRLLLTNTKSKYRFKFSVDFVQFKNKKIHINRNYTMPYNRESNMYKNNLDTILTNEQVTSIINPTMISS